MFTYDVGVELILIVTKNFGTSQAVYKSIEKDLKDNSGRKIFLHVIFFNQIAKYFIFKP